MASGLTSGLYWPGQSVLHRCGAGTKLLVLAVLVSAVVVIDTLVVSLAVALGSLAVARLAGIPWRTLGRLGIPVAIMAGAIAALHLLSGDGEGAASATARLLGIGCPAIVVTLTTRSTDIVAFVERALRTLRVRADRVFRFGLLAGTTTRAIEHLSHATGRILEARRARGLHRSTRAFAVPLVVEAGRFAHGVGEALVARGVTDSPGQAGEPAPYRFVSDRGSGPQWTPRGDELGHMAWRPPSVPASLVAEGIAQAAGQRCAQEYPGTRWLIAGIDDLTVDDTRWDQTVFFEVHPAHLSPRGCRLAVSAVQDGHVRANGAVLMTPLGGGEG